MNIRIEADCGDEGARATVMGLIDEKEKFNSFPPCRTIFGRARAPTSFDIFEECIPSFSLVSGFIEKWQVSAQERRMQDRLRRRDYLKKIFHCVSSIYNARLNVY